MAGTGTAPAITGSDIGGKLAELGSKMGDGVKFVGGVAGRAGVLVTAIFSSQQLGVDSDKIPGVNGKPQEGGLNNPGVMMGGRTKTQSQSKVEEKDSSCTDSNPNCKDGDHRGNIQAQEEKGMLVTTPAIAIWERKKPPSYNYAVGAATAVRKALLDQKGKTISAKDGLVPGDRGDKFQEGADKAYQVLLKVLDDNKNTGIFSIPKRYELSCYFDGKKYFGANLKYKKEKSRRIDLTVHKGQLMGPGAV